MRRVWVWERKNANRTAEFDPFIKSQLASRNQLLRLMWCKFGHVMLEKSRQRNPRTPPIGEALLVSERGVVSPSSSPLQNGRFCTANPACRVEDGLLAFNTSEAELDSVIFIQSVINTFWATKITTRMATSHSVAFLW